MPRFIALLRGINVGGHNRLPMAELRSRCTELGWRDVQTYIQSGNLLFSARGGTPALEAAIEKTILDNFGLSISVIIRSAQEWAGYPGSNPFPEASEREPAAVMLALSKRPLLEDAATELRKRAATSERIEQTGHALWIHFGSGSARSGITPVLLDRLAGSPVTTRNWRTVLKLDELARAGTRAG